MEKDRSRELEREANDISTRKIDMNKFWKNQSSEVQDQLEKNRKYRVKSLETALTNVFV